MTMKTAIDMIIMVLALSFCLGTMAVFIYVVKRLFKSDIVTLDDSGYLFTDGTSFRFVRDTLTLKYFVGMYRDRGIEPRIFRVYDGKITKFSYYDEGGGS